MRNIAAYTPATPADGDYVPFISINQVGERGELVSITVRQKAPGTPPQAEIILPRAEFALLLVEAQKNL